MGIGKRDVRWPRDEEANTGCDSVSRVKWVLFAIDVPAAMALIVLVLLHSGRGGGLSDMFGSGMGSTAAGSTVVEKNLDRITVVLALVFGFSTLALALLLDSN